MTALGRTGQTGGSHVGVFHGDLVRSLYTNVGARMSIDTPGSATHGLLLEQG